MRRVILCALLGLCAWGQDGPTVIFPYDGQVEGFLRRARNTLREGDTERAVRMLESVLALPDAEETFVEVEPVWFLPAKTRARRLLARTGEAGLAYYRERNEGRAADALAKAESPGEWAAVARQYPLTAAGSEALLRLATLALESGAPARALAWLAEAEGGEAVQRLDGLARGWLRGDGDSLAVLAGGAPRIWPGPKGAPDGSWCAPAGLASGLTADTAWLRPQPNVLPAWIWQLLEEPQQPTFAPDGLEPAFEVPEGRWDDAPFSTAVADAERLFLHDGRTASCIDLVSGRLVWTTALDPAGDTQLDPRGTYRCALYGDFLAVLRGQEMLLLLSRADGRIARRWPVRALAAEAGLEAELRFFPLLAGADGRLCLLLGSIEPVGETFAACLERDGSLAWARFIGAGESHPQACGDLVQRGGLVFAALAEGGLVALDAEGGRLLWARTFRPVEGTGSNRDWAPWFGERALPRSLPERDGPRLLGRADRLLVQRGPGGTVLEVGALSGRVIGESAAPPAGAVLLGPLGDGRYALGDRLGLTVFGGEEPLRLAFELAGLPPDTLAGPVLPLRDGFALPLRGGVALLDLDGEVRASLSAADEPARTLLALGERLLVVGPTRVHALGPPVPPQRASGDLVEDLAAADWRLRREAARAAHALGASADTLLTRLEASPLAELRWRAGRLGYERERAAKSAAWRDALPERVQSELPFVVDGLIHENPLIRDLVLRHLGQSYATDRLVPVFSALSEDPAAVVRISAAIELFRRGDRSGAAILRAALDAEAVERRRRAVWALVDFGSREDFEALRPLLGDEDFQIRSHVTGKLLEEQMLARSEVEALLDDPAPSLAFLAFETLLAMGGGDSAQLAGLLGRNLPANAANANRPPELIVAVELLRIKDRTAVEAVCSLTSHSDPRLRAWVQKKIFALAQDPERVYIPPASLVPLCRSELANDRFSALQILARLGGDEAQAALRAALDDENPQIRAWAVGKVEGAPAALAAAYLRGDTLSVRSKLLEALAKDPVLEALPALAAALEDDEPALRERAANGLLRLGTPAAGARLFRAWHATDFPEAELFERVFLRLPQTAREDALVLLLGGSEPGPRRAARQALEELSGPLDGEPPDDLAAALYAARHREERRAALGLDTRLAALGATSPRERWAAAEELRELGELAAAPEVLEGLLAALEGETVSWVRSALHACFAELSGCPLPYEAKAPAEARAEAVRALRAWLAE